MQVNRAATSAIRSVRTGMAGVAVVAPTQAVAPVVAMENDLSDEKPSRSFPRVQAEEDAEPETLTDAIDPAVAYRVASSLLRRQGMVGLLLNRNA